jgi:cobalt-zinc-cadmium efflux system membrane fusion protein
VTQIDRVLDPASNTFRVRLALPNPGHRLPAGLRCRVDLDALAAAGAPGPAPASARAASPKPAPTLPAAVAQR